jgi:formylmethanofuran dehydrogenase subunit A
MSKYRLVGGEVYVPANRVDGKIQDVWIEGGHVIAAPAAERAAEFTTIDVSGRIVMPGGVDMHSHVVGPKVNMARRMQPELFVADYLDDPREIRGNRIVPTIAATAFNYIGMGYTTVMDAAISPLAARQVHHELEHFPCMDAGFFVLVGNNHFLLEAAAKKDVDGAARFLSWLLRRCGAFAPKLVNPGGVENWKAGRHGTTRDLSTPVAGFQTNPRQIIETIANAANQIGLPHPIHLHCNNLGFPGNWSTTLETLRTLGGHRGHLAHIQFHSYGGTSPDSIDSQVDELAAYVNSHPEISVDVGQVLFGATTSMTGDGPLGHYLSQLSGRKWFAADVEIESSCGISPIEYSDKSRINALQWAIGLEWFLKVRDPWQIALSTDHPNGASFLAYPQIIHLLMSHSYRRSVWDRLPRRVRETCDLGNLTREYTLSEIAIITRAGPARLLGLKQKGHLSPGADADITVYSRDREIESMFQSPWLVMKGGEVIVQDHELVGTTTGKTLYAATTVDPASDDDIGARFAAKYTLSPTRFGVLPSTNQFSRVTQAIQ